MVPPTMVGTTGPSRGSGASCVGVHFVMRTAYEEPAHGWTARPRRGLRAEIAISGLIRSY
ncbi:hypothetical protein GCM10010424_56920 [Streptomyces lienomycini]